MLNVEVLFTLADARRKLEPASRLQSPSATLRTCRSHVGRVRRHLPRRLSPHCLRHSLELQYLHIGPLTRANRTTQVEISNLPWFSSPGAGHNRDNSNYEWLRQRGQVKVVERGFRFLR